MENKPSCGHYILGIYFLSLSMIIHIFSIRSGILVLDYFEVIRFVILIFLVTMAIGLMFRKTWASFLAKYIYATITAVVLLYLAYFLTVLLRSTTVVKFIIHFYIYFDVLFILFIFPVVLGFYFTEIKRLSLWLKIVLFFVCFSPVVFYIYLLL